MEIPRATVVGEEDFFGETPVSLMRSRNVAAYVLEVVEQTGIKPATSSLRTTRSIN